MTCSVSTFLNCSTRQPVIHEKVDHVHHFCLQVVIQKVSASERTRLQAEDPEGVEFAETIVRNMLGFTTIFHYLTELQKPLVLHNCLLDLMLIYKQVCDSLLLKSSYL